ncbi:MAG: hypothetical protein APF81_09025 [Desulfosporosinus sp. BRH_c37]|nr:MAG: hypothetical protein APF81_09025 [Desulfosporosinus sp. BRH_c37]
MQSSSELNGSSERSLESEQTREFLLLLIRQKIKDYPLSDRAIFELSYNTNISSTELINLNTSDVDFTRKIVRIDRGNETELIHITDNCVSLLEEMCSMIIYGDSPLFLNSKGERINLSNLWFIKRKFSIEIYPDP